MAAAEDVNIKINADPTGLIRGLRAVRVALGSADAASEMLDDMATLFQQNVDLRSQAQMLERLWEAAVDKLAEQALINEELRARVDWYRNLYHGALDPKRALLKTLHRLNGEF